ncbi:Part of AAA domain-containing protein [Streptomyces sp. 2224.1]|uniref:AAA domain-containing protein n=1 Tax=unclassified Streptomyces TaxID=2593676 RepID=UPI000886DAD0|nr:MULTISPECIES: AAA domain-containing protein [unclassified Streptomyces]PBC82572.1 AAA domain-containing protein [Streptomyces sp. 2321.6]SDR48800.1 Part of AAA domain-containing protein [Streptomyces sp. KS_16]SEC41624.1 Part of AAA domain-containing protein [Streptomyces sp. 2224.1]SEC63245.1 Part of AAA domain-containing protein [Streptomyces sp. 2133.1]SEE95633.1 Part of AAA domain-containing protein [Streptomyces sp. 2112.3]
MTAPQDSPAPVPAPAAKSFDPAAAAAAATEAILHDTLHGSRRGVVVDSPPGAGKSTLVVRAARELAAAGRPLMVVAQTNAQVDDLVLRLAEKDPQLPVGRLHSSEPGAFDPALAELPAVRTSAKAADLAGMDIVVSTAAKWAYTKVDEPWRHAIVDEAYQMRSDALLSVAGLFERALFVGDPGQLDPFSVVGAEQWAGLAYDPSASAVSTLLAHNPDLPQHRLPVSWRLPASAAPLVSAAFYPYTPFRSGTGHGDRRLAFGVPGDGSGVDRVLDEAAESGWGLLELPARRTPRTDPEAVRAVAQVVRRLLDRGGAASSEARRDPDGGAAVPVPLTAARIAVGTAHRDQAAAVRAALAELGVFGVAVDTANRLQGREFDVTVVLHPLSGRPDATAFHLETGRLCVLASRHRHACIVVCRAGVADLLDEHPSTEPVRLGVTVKFPDGWEANHAVLAHLAEHRVAWRP